MELNLVQIKEDLKKNRKQKNRVIELRLYVLGGSISAKNLKKFLIKNGVSERTYFRWKKNYLEKGVAGLEFKKGRGRKKNWIRGKVASKIKYFRKEYLWGAEVICAHLEMNVSQYKVNRFLKEQNLITSKKKQKKKKHDKVVVIKKPGEFTQMDVKHLTELHHSIKRYAYNFVDHASRWSYKHIFDSYGPSETRLFMNMVIQYAPFDILKEQTDNGIEFTNKFISDPLEPKEHALDAFCKEHGIIHKLIPVGEKEINGLVEKHNHLDDKEFYRKQKTIDLEVLNRRLHKHCLWRNENRRYKANKWQSPNQYIAAYNAFNKIKENSGRSESVNTLAA